MAAELIVTKGAQSGLVFRLDREETRIGRIGCDIVLADRQISRVHARIIRQGATCDIEDMESRNGLFVNDVKVLQARLADGDRIALGNTVMQFRCTSSTKEHDSESDQPSRLDTTHTITLDARERQLLTQEVDEKNIRSLQRAKSDLEAIYRADQMINTVLDPEALVSRILDIILAEMPKVGICSLHLLLDDTGKLICRGQRRRVAAGATESPAFSTSLIRLVLQERKAVLTYDAQQDKRLNVEGSIAFLNIRSAMCVPLQSRDHLLGVLQTNALQAEQRFDREDLKLLTAIGVQAGTALENALLYDKLAAEKAALHEAHERLKSAHDGLVQSEKLAAVGRLTAGIVHDVKNPMTIILTYAELLERQLKGHGIEKVGEMNVLESLKTIQEGVLNCNEIISQLLQFAKQAPPAKRLMHINELVESTLSFLSHEMSKAKVQPDKHLAPDLPPILADANQIRQVLLNILINALQALKAPGGQIRIVTAADQIDGKPGVVCRIQDNGQGMTEDVKKRLFEPFFTTKHKEAGLGGTGMGLSVSYGIIQNHGGTIAVESEPGQGTTFSIKLPVNDTSSSGQAGDSAQTIPIPIPGGGR